MKESEGHLCPSLSMSFEGGTNQWKSMCAMFAATVMIPLWVIRTMESPLGTAFEDLPEDWVCPLCGVGKDQFSKE